MKKTKGLELVTMFQVLDQKSGMIYAEFSELRLAYDLIKFTEGARIQMVQRPLSEAIPYRSTIEAYSDDEIPTTDFVDFDLSDAEPTKVGPLARRASWREWISRTVRTSEVRAYECALES